MKRILFYGPNDFLFREIYKNLLGEKQNGIKQTWKHFGSILNPKRCEGQQMTKRLISDGANITESSIISETVNKHFSPGFERTLVNFFCPLIFSLEIVKCISKWLKNLPLSHFCSPTLLLVVLNNWKQQSDSLPPRPYLSLLLSVARSGRRERSDQ